MKRVFLLLVLVSACNTEQKVGPVHANTFVRYFNGGNNDTAETVLQTADGGFIILASTEIKPSELAASYFKIKLIKTDAYGNEVWHHIYPEFGQDVVNNVQLSYKGHGLLISADGGYVIAGEDIDIIKGSSQLMVMTTDADGTFKGKKTMQSTLSIAGVAVANNLAGNYVALGYVTTSSATKNMVLGEFNKSSLDSVWSTGFGAGQVTLANRLFLDNSDNAFWGGTVIKSSSDLSAIRFVKVVTAASNPGGIDFDLPVTKPGLKETGNDFCRFGDGFAVIGSTNGKADGSTGDLDILFKRLSSNGSELSSQSFPITTGDGQNQNETGNSICTTLDGGLLLLGTVTSQGSFGRGDKDYYLIKIDAFGATSWTQTYGSKFEDDGVNVIQASDGGYVVLGTTSLANIKTVMLMKTDKSGKIQ